MAEEKVFETDKEHVDVATFFNGRLLKKMIRYCIAICDSYSSDKIDISDSQHRSSYPYFIIDGRRIKASIQDIVSRYGGLKKGLDSILDSLSNPRRYDFRVGVEDVGEIVLRIENKGEIRFFNYLCPRHESYIAIKGLGQTPEVAAENHSKLNSIWRKEIGKV